VNICHTVGVAEAASGWRRGTLKELPTAERPRERLFAHGPEKLSDAELLGILLGTGVPGATAVDLGRRLVARFGGLRGLERRAAADLAAERGIGPARAARLTAGLELGRRAAAAPLPRGLRIAGVEDVLRRFGPLLAGLGRERLFAVFLDRRNRVLGERLIAEGTIAEAAFHPREVFEPALREGASSVILVHNHPSGDPAPSEADRAITLRLAIAGRALGILVLDHVIIGGNDAVSLADLADPSVEPARTRGP
jgi:DNA repair protein RadC